MGIVVACISVCVYMCVRERRGRVCVCVRERGREGERECVCERGGEGERVCEVIMSLPTQ